MKQYLFIIYILIISYTHYQVTCFNIINIKSNNQYKFNTILYQNKKNDNEEQQMMLEQKENTTNNNIFTKIPIINEIYNMFINLDDIIDDFFNKRMGNGEVFYGQRKYKPSNKPNTLGKYDGMGMTDKVRIDIARSIKQERIERLQRLNELENK